MIYVLRVPTSTVIGTSMVLTLVTMVFATMRMRSPITWSTPCWR